MTDPASRMLRLLSLLQTHAHWSASDLAERLGVTTRTIRRDVDRLRELGYPVGAVSGPAGGYRLEAGTELPPLLLDDEEAVAMAVGLRTAASGSVAGIEEASLRALAKIEQVMPSRLRRRVAAVHTFTVPMPTDAPRVDPENLAVISLACRDRERLRFRYRTHDGRIGRRMTEPHRLVSAGRRWYLVAWDVDRRDWRSYRVDRLDEPQPTGLRFSPRELPAPDAAAFVADAMRAPFARHEVVVLVKAPIPVAVERLTPSMGVVEVVDEASCVLRASTDSLEWFALHLGLLGLEFTVLAPDALATCVRDLSGRLARAAAPVAVQT